MTTKAAAVLQSSTSNAATGTTTSSVLDVRAIPKSSVLVRIVNGGAGPTVGCTARVDLSPDGTLWYLGAGGAYQAGAANSGEYGASFSLDEDAMYVRVVFFGNTVNAVTVQAHVTSLTAL